MAARKVHGGTNTGPIGTAELMTDVSQAPSPGLLSEASPVLFTVNVAPRLTPIQLTSSAITRKSGAM